MRLEGPVRYQLQFSPTGYRATCPRGNPNFTGLASRDIPKLYVVVDQDWPVYVGITKRPMSARFREGWSATGKHGYYGYAFRHSLVEAALDVWAWAGGGPDSIAERELETLEAELVFLVRQQGQWPAHQTEIHFRPSEERHRSTAASILSRYTPPARTES